MKSKNIAYFLVIASFLWILLDLNGLFYNIIRWNATEYFQMGLNLLLSSSSAVGFTWIGFSLLRNERFPDKKVGIVFAVLSGLHVGMRVYYNISYFSELPFRAEPLNAILSYLMIIFPVCVFTFWLLLSMGKAEKGAVWLLIGAVFSCVSSFAGKIFIVIFSFSQRNPFTDDIWGDFTYTGRVIDFLYPLTLAMLAFSILKVRQQRKFNSLMEVNSGHDELLDGIVESTETPLEAMQQKEKNPSVLDWLSDFLLTLIPIFGLGFLVWRGRNIQDKYRRNWAIATLFWIGLSFSLLAFLYAPILQRFENDGMITIIVVLFILAIFCTATVLVNKVQEEGAEEEEVPSISTWFGRSFVISLPLIGLIFLIVWATDNDNAERKKWALASLLRMAVALMYYLSMYVTFSNM